MVFREEREIRRTLNESGSCPSSSMPSSPPASSHSSDSCSNDLGGIVGSVVGCTRSQLCGVGRLKRLFFPRMNRFGEQLFGRLPPKLHICESLVVVSRAGAVWCEYVILETTYCSVFFIVSHQSHVSLKSIFSDQSRPEQRCRRHFIMAAPSPPLAPPV